MVSWYKERQEAVGFDEKRCWICDRKRVKRAGSHHATGRKDPDSPLVMLCRSCHGLVTELARRAFLADPQKVADLITLARFAAGLPDAKTIVKYEFTKGA